MLKIFNKKPNIREPKIEVPPNAPEEVVTEVKETTPTKIEVPEEVPLANTVKILGEGNLVFENIPKNYVVSSSDVELYYDTHLEKCVSPFSIGDIIKTSYKGKKGCSILIKNIKDDNYICTIKDISDTIIKDDVILSSVMFKKAFKKPMTI